MESLIELLERMQLLCCNLFRCGGGVDGSEDGGVEMVAVGCQADSGRSQSSSSSDVSGEFLLHSKTIRA